MLSLFSIEFLPWNLIDLLISVHFKAFCLSLYLQFSLYSSLDTSHVLLQLLAFLNIRPILWALDISLIINFLQGCLQIFQSLISPAKLDWFELIVESLPLSSRHWRVFTCPFYLKCCWISGYMLISLSFLMFLLSAFIIVIFISIVPRVLYFIRFLRLFFNGMGLIYFSISTSTLHLLSNRLCFTSKLIKLLIDLFNVLVEYFIRSLTLSKVFFLFGLVFLTFWLVLLSLLISSLINLICNPCFS